MQRSLTLRLSLTDFEQPGFVLRSAAHALGVEEDRITGYEIRKKSLDARSRNIYVNLTLHVSIDEPHQAQEIRFVFRDVSQAGRKAIIIGAGPAGLFASLKLISLGIQPILLERGKDVKSRRRDLAKLNKEGIIDPDSNYCFGEGGAGTYSDGKLYTRSTKRGDLQRILQLFAFFGASHHILYEAHPHIGTNKLPQIITAMRRQIQEAGGQFLFEQKVTGLEISDNRVTAVRVADGAVHHADAFVLATGHSARDIFEMLDSRKLHIENKPFALGVRVEHPQALIDSIQYHTAARGDLLPPAAYNLVHQADGRGVFSFCMCPGGIIAPAATSAGELVVNGWSPSKRNNPFANSGIVVPVEQSDLVQYQRYGALAGMHFQRDVESAAYDAGGGRFVAPAQRLADYVAGKSSGTLPACSYIPGITPAPLRDILPAFIHDRLVEGFRAFGRKMKGYLTNDAVVVATESRTSSPVRIPRHPTRLHHPQLVNLFPCGEGAGYAGGIISAAMDGEKVGEAIGDFRF